MAHGGQHGGRTDLVQRLHPFTDCGVLDAELEQQLADEWIVSEPHTSTCAAFLAERDTASELESRSSMLDQVHATHRADQAAPHLTPSRGSRDFCYVCLLEPDQRPCRFTADEFGMARRTYGEARRPHSATKIRWRHVVGSTRRRARLSGRRSARPSNALLRRNALDLPMGRAHHITKDSRSRPAEWLNDGAAVLIDRDNLAIERHFARWIGKPIVGADSAPILVTSAV